MRKPQIDKRAPIVKHADRQHAQLHSPFASSTNPVLAENVSLRTSSRDNGGIAAMVVEGKEDDDESKGEEKEGGEEEKEDFANVNQLSSNDGRDKTGYDLYGIVQHHGATLTAGHYVATIRDDAANDWKLFNDAAIHSIKEDEVVDKSAYVLFYMREDMKADMDLSSLWQVGESNSPEDMEKLLMKQREGKGCSVM